MDVPGEVELGPVVVDFSVEVEVSVVEVELSEEVEDAVVVKASVGVEVVAIRIINHLVKHTWPVGGFAFLVPSRVRHS